ncbi:MAG TPA: nitroreductase family protein [Prosthecobacter sp.]|nr:nitroreductase family protein [Prosthecobacter sp.]
MTALEAIHARRAVKRFDPEHRMPEADVRQLMEAAMQAPTAFNIQHWRFVLVTDPDERKRIRSAAWEQGQTTDASLLVVLCAKLTAWKDAPRYWRNAPPPVREFLLPAIQQYYEGNDQAQRDECMRSCGLAGMALMLAAKDMGYDSCPMDGFDFDAVGQVINLPKDHLIAFMIAIGKGIQPPWPKPGQLSYDEVVIQNTFAPS